MLTRVLCALLIWGSVIQAEQHLPHVVLVQLEQEESKEWIPNAWQHITGDCLVSPSRSGIQTALFFGTSPLQQGVVSDLDWRRKPVTGTTLADIMQKAGYDTRFDGAWALGSTSPYNPKSRGFEQAYYFEDAEYTTIADPWEVSAEKSPPLFEVSKSNKIIFRFVVAGYKLSRAQILTELKAWMTETKEPAVVIVLETSPVKKGEYHQSAKWHYLCNQNVLTKPDIQIDKDIYRVINNHLGNKILPRTSTEIFHKANWPLHESTEKNKFRGSLVVSGDTALIDGLHLYRASMYNPDLTKPYDIADFQDKHTELLTTYGKWWQRTGKALRDPRAFDVGEKDNQATRLTALDWRPSKIVDAEENSPTSTPVIGQRYLLDVLAGLKNNPEYREKFPAYSGSWSVNIKRPGRYQITASLLPTDIQNPESKELMKLNGGTAHIRLGSNVAQLNLSKGASAITLQTDADAGITDLECWFTGQLALTRELGAFFVEIKRVGDKKFDLKAK